MQVKCLSKVAEHLKLLLQHPHPPSQLSEKGKEGLLYTRLPYLTSRAMNRVSQEDIERYIYNYIYIRTRKNLQKQDAWKIIYELLLWCVTVKGENIPHIVEVNELNRSRIWFERAIHARSYISQELGVKDSDLCAVIDMLIKGLKLTNKQRQNYLGKGFSASLKILLKILLNIDSKKELSYSSIKGLEDIGRGKVDLALPPPNYQVLVSTKWSLRHDRLRDLINEATECKRKRPDIIFLVVTNEYQKARLSRVIECEYVDAVYHVHKPLLIALGLDPPNSLKDLVDFFNDIKAIIP